MSETGRKYKVWEPLLLSLVAIIGMLAGAKLVQSGQTSNRSETSITNTRYSGRQVEEIIRFLETKYVGEVNSEELVARAIEAIMQGLDPHTHYFPPERMQEVEEKTLGHYVGIGIEVAFLGDSLMILYPKANSPAAKAGLRPGDYILGVDDLKIPADSLEGEEIYKKIRGAKGSKVRLTIKPMLSDSIRVVEVTRDEIKVPSVIAAYMADTAVAYIKVQRFTNTTYREFMDAWEKLYTTENARHLILDLRDNPGGFLKESVNMLSQIIQEEGKVLVYTQGNKDKRIEYKSTGKIFFPVENITVLINEGSASASEIIAGCIQDLDRGLVMGTPSFGKGLVQEQFELSNGGILRMTVSKYYTPSGRSIQKSYDSLSVVDTQHVFKTLLGRPVHAGGGIVPDIVIKERINWNDPVQKKWMDVISEYAIRHNLLVHGGNIMPVERVPEILSKVPQRSELVTSLTALAKHRMPKEEGAMMIYLKDHEDDVIRITEAAIAAYMTGEEGWYRAFNLSDPLVSKAKDMIRLDLLLALQQN